MSPYEIAYAGGANEHWNEEAGQVWLARAGAMARSPLDQPGARRPLGLHAVDRMIRQIFEDRMVPMTLEGLDRGMTRPTLDQIAEGAGIPLPDVIAGIEAAIAGARSE
jgi:uncharacterized protein with von Willebrand factor type A (vWA) domain